ncbi:MAG: ATP-binding protein, partial [Chloroflexota bacterium]
WLGDGLRLEQVLFNLVGNAVKFTERGNVVVKVMLKSSSARHIELFFTVEDTGIGIPQAARQRLFQPFTQVEGSLTRRYGGTGLGLVISKRLVEMMGGKIDVESEAGHGSTFWFTVFLEQAAPAETQQAAPPALRGMQVLIAEENPLQMEILNNYLVTWGVQCTKAADGFTALGYVRRSLREGKPFQAALLDLRLPELNSRSLAEAIAKEYGAQAFPLIELSGYDDLRSVLQADPPEPRLMLNKPVKRGELLEALQRAVVTAAPAPPRQPPAAPARPKAQVARTAALKMGRMVLLVEDDVDNGRLVLL